MKTAIIVLTVFESHRLIDEALTGPTDRL